MSVHEHSGEGVDRIGDGNKATDKNKFVGGNRAVDRSRVAEGRRVDIRKYLADDPIEGSDAVDAFFNRRM